MTVRPRCTLRRTQLSSVNNQRMIRIGLRKGQKPLIKRRMGRLTRGTNSSWLPRRLMIGSSVLSPTSAQTIPLRRSHAAGISEGNKGGGKVYYSSPCFGFPLKPRIEACQWVSVCLIQTTCLHRTHGFDNLVPMILLSMPYDEPPRIQEREGRGVTSAPDSHFRLLEGGNTSASGPKLGKMGKLGTIS